MELFCGCVMERDGGLRDEVMDGRVLSLRWLILGKETRNIVQLTRVVAMEMRGKNPYNQRRSAGLRRRLSSVGRSDRNR